MEKLRKIPLLLLLVMLLASCATSRTTSTLQEATLQEAHQSERAEEVAAATLDEQRHNVQQTQTDVLTTKQLFAEPIPSEQTSLEIPTQNLLNLPEGAKYGTHSGRASVEAERRGDNIVVTGKCDSIARRCVYFESQVFRQREVIDSLAQLLIAERAKYRQLDSLSSARSGTMQVVQTTRKSPATWHWWLLFGFLAGGTTASLLTKTNPLKTIVQLIKQIL